MKGIVKWFDARKGYGFIVADGIGKDIFFHFTDIQGIDDKFKSVLFGEHVEFDIVNVAVNVCVNVTERLQATNVRRCPHI